MKVIKTSRVHGSEFEISLDQALAALREFNQEYTKGKSDAEIIEQLKRSPIHTNLSHYCIKETR